MWHVGFPEDLLQIIPLTIWSAVFLLFGDRNDDGY